MNIYNTPVLTPSGSEEAAVLESIGLGLSAKVILFDDDIHTFNEVIKQLIKAVGCTFEKAESLTFEVHTKGKSVVYEGELPDCLRVSSVLEEIALHTRVEI